MRVGFLPLNRDKEVRHLFRQIPAIDRAAVDDHKTIAESQLSSPPSSLIFVKAKEVEVGAAGNDFVNHFTILQHRPLSHDRPDSLGERHYSIRRRQRASLR